MNAHKFVAEKGIDEAKRVLSGAPDWATHFDGYLYSEKQFHGSCISLSELKQVVESVELTDWHGGLKYAKSYLDRNSKKYPGVVDGWDMLKKAIADYELVESYKSRLVEYLDECEQVVDTWPNWKKESVRHAFGFGGKNDKCEVLDMVDVSPRCEVRNG